MACQRNRISELVQYLESLGIEVNIGKNKARGNKGLFKVQNKQFRIDIAQGQSNDAILKTLIHEFAHFIHYNYDKSLKSLNFIMQEDDVLTEELIQLTVDSIPKDSIAPIFHTKRALQKEIKSISNSIKTTYPDFKLSEPFKPIENKIKKTDLRYLIKHDKVKLIDGLCTKIYSIDNIDSTEDIKNYLKLKSLQRQLRRINTRINHLNKYYNSPTELFARSIEMYFTKPKEFNIKAPNVANSINNANLPLIENLKKILL